MTKQTQAIELLTKLVSIPSPSTREAKASAYLAGWMNAHGFTAHVDEAGNTVGAKGDGEKEILLLGHIDTFPGKVPVRQEGNVLYGRGSVDAKGPLCSFAVAASQVTPPAGWRITVVGAVEEESATSKGAQHVLAQRFGPGNKGAAGPGSMPHPVFCIIGEPSNWDRVTLGYKGRLLMDVNLRVPFSHSAGKGRLPAEQAVDLWRQIETCCTTVSAEQEATSPFTRLDPALRHISSRDEGAFGAVEMSIGFRLPVWVEPAELETKNAAANGNIAGGNYGRTQFCRG